MYYLIKMEPETMLDELKTKEETLRNELITLESQFNVKKEQYLKVQGAIEALTMVDPQKPLVNSDPETTGP
jgi:chaperonin cofactor prefoldin